MTDYRENRRSKSRSLYLGLFRSIILGVIFGIVAYAVLLIPSVIFIHEYYVTEEKQAARREEYLIELQTFVTNEEIGMENADRIAEWVRENPYVYLLVYSTPTVVPTVSIPESPPPGDSFLVSEHAGSGIDDSIDRDELIEAACKNGFYYIALSGGSVTVAINEYTENLYYTTVNTVSFIIAVLVFILFIVNYVRVIIERIKRFESDVTIVSEMDMTYEIVSEGADEIAKLSTNVERMRQRMLDHIKSEQEARQANTELITSISHDIRTPLTVLMGYIEMMKERETGDEIMDSYVAATENTALRLKQLSDDMFKYSLAFGDTKGMINLEEYDAVTLFDQLVSEHIVLMREMGYDIHTLYTGEGVREGGVVVTDAQNLMRIIDNIFSNLRKYADASHPILITFEAKGGKMIFECENKVKTDTEEAESNGIGLKTCKRLASLIADRFEYGHEGDYFTCRLILSLRQPLMLDAEMAEEDR